MKYRGTLSTALLLCMVSPLAGGELVITIESKDRPVDSIGVVKRFNADGTPAREVDPKAQFGSPFRDAVARMNPAHFRDLKPGVYDAIVFLRDGTRLEGFHWPVFNEFDDPHDPVFNHAPPEEVDKLLRQRIAATRYYENKVTPLVLAGGDKQVRVLMQLLRDDKTSFDAQFGAPVATLRYEIWQFTNNFGGWTRDRHSKVLHRILDAKANVRKQTWLWDHKLGGLKITRSKDTLTLTYRIPEDLKPLKGLHPY